jgi:hypothetical protein
MLVARGDERMMTNRLLNQNFALQLLHVIIENYLKSEAIKILRSTSLQLLPSTFPKLSGRKFAYCCAFELCKPFRMIPLR